MSLLAAAVATVQLANVSAAPPAESPRDVYSVGRCIVRADRSASARLVGALPLGGGDVGPDAAAIVASTGCLKAPLAGDAALILRGAIAQELFFTDFKEFGVAPRNRGSWVDFRLPTESDGAAATGATAQLYKWADCVVRNDTGNTEKLLRSGVGSRQEESSLQAMQPYMAACKEKGARLIISKEEVRSLFAQSAYNSLYRYWSGELRQAAAEGEEYAAAGGKRNGKFVVCKRFPVAGSHVRTARWCMTEANWEKARLQNRAWAHETIDKGLK